MMAGYTPVFDTVFTGSLCGRYPDTAAWLFFLALADARGEVDKTPEYIASVTGMPLADLRGCIERFCQPDPMSRSQAEEGRKLVLIDGRRSWGWRIVNVELYRRRAADRNRTASGADAARKRAARHSRRPTASRDVPPSPSLAPDTNTDTDSNSLVVLTTSPPEKTLPPDLALEGVTGVPPAPASGESRKERRRRLGHFVPDGWEIPDEDAKWALEEFPALDLFASTQKFRDHEFAKPRSDWRRTWRNWIRAEGEMQAARRANGRR